MKAIVLAAGLGKRMNSNQPKVTHKILDKAMINWVLSAVFNAGIAPEDTIVVTGYKAETVEAILPEGVKTVRQLEQLGTGHAVMQVLESVELEGKVLVLPGDVPLIRAATLRNLMEKLAEGLEVVVLTTELNEPAEYGRVISKNGRVRIVEAKDATPEEKKIKEINTGIYVFSAEFLKSSLKMITPNNAQKEYYLTDVVQFAERAERLILADPTESLGINDRIQLSKAQRIARKKINYEHMLNGVTIIDPDTTYIGPDVVIGKDTVIEPMTFIYGHTVIGEKCVIGPMTRIIDSKIFDDVKVTRSEVEGAMIHNACSVGPYSRLRPGAVLLENVKVGNFVEIKKSTIGSNSKAQHLTYLGDAEIGENVNVGAGTITCNYDGKNKHRTTIGANAFIGSNTSLVAPVSIGKNSIVGAGSVITENVPDYSLALGRARQIVKINRYRKNEEGE
ncbi:bifunctional UDP-N-acetylglucosamine diphosphorylase/glucosamine-1-phosphate N-acetyltransferase GlmU [Kosmotoga pacifica]|uniref:Bifunctional protein GlmU n=1 Tax=Kosmotoga pacifica TaxID=1330330 RepID=A0A0G2Z5J0_9BACT|nr:bifunctional UDP-N-acetylglucosamine diphosphorylase/glucosamine-1-phosphate N-acetyltransferase GlmU [Kosmotoga pacifica]AKI96885.1 bifunctional N-acetylglucosamine-1-phosphate uridyltransferase/glucosamine-1-phosphate acetyltransferase [Kosmotoga pacifica]